MNLDATLPAAGTRDLELKLTRALARLEACRTRPLDTPAVSELTTLRFEATRLARRLRLTTGSCDLRCEQPALRLATELKDARSMAARRGVLFSLRIEDLALVTDERKVIDALASLVEDALGASANFLSLETRPMAHPAGSPTAELTLTTDATLHHATFGVLVLRAMARARAQEASLSVRVERSTSELSRIVIGRDLPNTRQQKAQRWTAISPNRI